MKISVIFPVLNEVSLLRDSLTHFANVLQEVEGRDWEVILADGGSRDGSLPLAAEMALLYGWTLVGRALERPSVGRTVALGLERASGNTILILPVDTWVTPGMLWELSAAVASEPLVCGGFPKAYTPNSRVLNFYARLQNVFRLKVLKQVVWTNGIFFPRTLFKSSPLPMSGFLEDVVLSDRLRKSRYWRAMDNRLLVSARKYYPDRVLKRIFINLGILILYRLGRFSPSTLRRLYG